MIIILITLLLTHITIMCVTLYLHRSQAHRAVEFHPIVNHFMRFWLWLTTGNFTTPTSALTAKSSANPYGGLNTAAVGAGFTKLLLVP
jgi:stearoyl-CoA desaturase (delta-9 desaturase)